MMLPKLDLTDPDRAMDGWRRTEPGGAPDWIAEHAASTLEWLGEAVEELGERIELAAKRLLHQPAVRDEREANLRKLEEIDRSTVYLADPAATTPTISGIRMPGGARITAVIAVRAPDDAMPGDQFRFDVIQRRKGEIVGGSTYALAVFDDGA